LLDVAALSRLSATYDEGGHVAFGRSVLERRSLPDPAQKMAISVASYLPTHVARALGVHLSTATALFLSRLPTVLASLVLGVLVFLWSSTLYGAWGALLATAVYAVCPTVLAHSQLATNDLYCAALMFASTLLFVRYLEGPTLAAAALCALVTGAAQVTKHTALLLFPLFAALWLVDAARRGRAPGATTPRRLAHGALAVLIVLAVVNATYLFRESFLPARVYVDAFRVWPAEARSVPALATLASFATWAGEAPVPLPSAYVYALTTGVYYNALGLGHGPVYLLGELSRTGWWYYFLVAIVLKTPLGVLLLLAAAIAMTGTALRKRPLDETALLLAPVVILAFFSFACTAQIGIRYVLPMFPFLHVAIGKVATYAPARWPAAYRGTVGALVAWAALSTLSFHPYYLSYFNELIGARTNMYRYLADSNVDWGQNARDLRRYLVANGAGAVTVNPAAPVEGRVVVNVNSLVGVLAPADRYRWLREGFEPVDHIGYGWLVYDVPRR
jgi:4-amino-4-deoxy-L-arabinose transferase-like glycosyltransferase